MENLLKLNDPDGKESVLTSSLFSSLMDEPLPIINSHLSVRAKPNARDTRITRIGGDTAFIDIAAPPEDDKANLELLKFLRRQTDRSCKIKSGAKSKNKLIVFD